jgi:hypothetical protein
MKCIKRIATEEFKEEDHPRDEDGKFVKKGGGSSHTKDNFDEFIKELDDIKYEKNDDVIRYIKHNLNEIEKYGKPTDLEKEEIIVEKMEADWLESLNLDKGDIFEKFRIENPTKKDEWGNWVEFDKNSYIESMPEDLKKMYKDVKSKKEHEIEYSKKNNKWTPYYEPFSDYPFLYPKLSKYQKDELASEKWDSYDFEEKQNVYHYFFKKELEEDIDYADLDYYEKQEIRNDWSQYGELTDSYLTKEKEWYYQDKEYKKLYDEYSKLGVSYGEYNERGIESNFWNYYKGVPEKQSIKTINSWRFKIMFANNNDESVKYKIPKYPIVDKLSVEEHNNLTKELRDKTPNIKKEISNDFKNIIDYAEKKEDLQFQLHSVSNFAKQMGREKSDLKELFLNEIKTGNITISDFVSNYEKSKQLEFFSDMITSNEDIEKMYNDLTKKMDKINHENYDLFLKSPEFYRGTTTEELDSFIKDETFKSGKYDFKSLSMDRKQATGNSINSNADGFRCVIVFEGDGVRDVGIPVQYNPVPVEPNLTFGDKSERIDTPLPMVFLEEREVRIPIGKKIPKIKELNFGDSLSEDQKKEILDKYSSLTNNIKFEKFRADEKHVIKSIGSESFNCMKKATEEFREDDHPRDEDGKFTNKGSGVNKKIKDLGKKIQRNTHKDILLKYTEGSLGKQWYNDLQGAIGGKEQYQRYIEAEKKWKNMIDNEPEFKKIYEDLKKDVDDYNMMLEDKFENTDVFYRGTSLEELESYIKDKCIGCDFQSRYHGGEGKLYDFVSMSMNTEELWLFNKGIIIEYDAESIRNNGAKRIEYSAYPVPFMAQTIHVENKLNLEEMNIPYPHRFAEEQEVRMGKTDISEISIKKIHVDMTKIEGTLRNHVGLKNHNNADDFFQGKDSEEIRKRLLNMYGSIVDDVIIHEKGIDYDTI